MNTLGREPNRKNIMQGILDGAIPINSVRDIQDVPTRLALETIVLSPVIQRFVLGFDRDNFISDLHVSPLESGESLTRRAFDAYVRELKTKTRELLISQARGEFGDERRAGWTKLFGEHFEQITTILEPIESAYEKLGHEAIRIVGMNHPGELSIVRWGEELHDARKILTSIASLTKGDSDRTVRPLRQAGHLPDYVTRRNNGAYHLDLNALVPATSRVGRGCPMNSVDPEGAPDIHTTLLLNIHQVFTDTLSAIGKPVTPQLIIGN